MINLLDDSTNQPSKFGKINCIDESQGSYNVIENNNNNIIRFKISMVKSNLL